MGKRKERNREMKDIYYTVHDTVNKNPHTGL